MGKGVGESCSFGAKVRHLFTRFSTTDLEVLGIDLNLKDRDLYKVRAIFQKFSPLMLSIRIRTISLNRREIY